MAIEDINSLSSFISRGNETYGLQADFVSVGKNDVDGVESLQKLYNSAETIFGVIGPPYGNQEKLTNQFSSTHANIQIGYSKFIEPSPRLRILVLNVRPSITAKFLAARSLLNFFKWKKVAIIFDYSDRNYRRNVDELQLTLETSTTTEYSIYVSTLQRILGTPDSYSVTKEFDMIQEKGSRIILALLTVTSARIVFCEAYKRNMKKPEITWILFEKLPEGWASGTYGNNSYKSSEVENDCSTSELLRASEGYISLAKQSLRTDNVANDGNQTKDTYLKRMKKRAHHYSCPDDTAYAYDSVWVLGNYLRELSEHLDIASFTYDSLISSFRSWIKMTTSTYFEGITGPIRFELKKKK